MSTAMRATSGFPMATPLEVSSAAEVQRERLRRVIRIVLKAAREDADISQTELAWRLEWTRNQVANLEGGRREIGLADFIMIARALRVDPDRMLQRILQW